VKHVSPDGLILSRCCFGLRRKPWPAARVPVRLRAEINGRLPDLVETGAYYVVGEALTDSAKHANVTIADISIGQRGQFLAPAVRDDGEGADPTALGWPASPAASTPSPEPIQLLSLPGRGTRLFVNLSTGTGPTVAARSRGRPQERRPP
jgi:hypothetical protein